MENFMGEKGINLQEVKEQTITTPTGTLLDIFMQRKIRSQRHIEEEQEIDNIIYEIPSETGLNTILWLRRESGLPVPLATATMQLIGGVPTVVMLQRVITDSATAPRSDSLIPHPYRHLLQGTNRIPWEEVLLHEQERIAFEAGYSQLKLRSAFEIPYTKHYYDLSIAVQQYDRVASRLGWTPYDGSGQPIQDEKRKTLDGVLRKLRDKKIKTREDISKQHPSLSLPSFWHKTLS